MNDSNVIISMSQINCSICSQKHFVFFRSEQEILDYRCIGCNSTFMSINSWEFNEKRIEYFRMNAY